MYVRMCIIYKNLCVCVCECVCVCVCVVFISYTSVINCSTSTDSSLPLPQFKCITRYLIDLQHHQHHYCNLHIHFVIRVYSTSMYLSS